MTASEGRLDAIKHVCHSSCHAAMDDAVEI